MKIILGPNRYGTIVRIHSKVKNILKEKIEIIGQKIQEEMLYSNTNEV